MSFQAYLDNIKTKTGKGADEFKRLADKKGSLKKDNLKLVSKQGKLLNG